MESDEAKQGGSIELRYGTSLLGAGIPALNDTIDVCFSIHQSALFRGDGDSQLPAGPLAARGHRAAKQRSESRRFLL